MTENEDRPRVVYHLASERDWVAAQREGTYRVSTRGATVDEVGYVHASFAGQLAGTASRFYADVTEPMVVLVIAVDRLGCEVVVEPAPGGERFPHLYGPVPVAAVLDVIPAGMRAGRLTIR